MRAAVIINPKSGSSASRATADGSRLDLAKQWVAAENLTADLVVTSGPGHASELSAGFAAAGFERVVAWGGDGTVNEVAGPLVGTATALGVIPGGSGDGLARSLRLPRDPQAAIRLALTGHTRQLDVGWLGGRHFLNIAGVGFDATVARQFNRRSRRGTRGYMIDGLVSVWTYACATYRVCAGQREFEGPRFLVAFANGREYGSGLVIAPEADPFDGWFDMLLVAGGGPFTQLWRARRLVFRRMREAQGIWRDRIQHATIAGDVLSCHVDGETFEATGAVDVRLDPGALRVVVA